MCLYIYLLLNDRHASSASLYLMPSQFLFICWRSSIFLSVSISLYVLLLASSLHNYWDGLENVVFSFFSLLVVFGALPLSSRKRLFSLSFFFLFGRGRVRKQKHGGDLEPHDQIKHPFIIIFWLVHRPLVKLNKKLWCLKNESTNLNLRLIVQGCK